MKSSAGTLVVFSEAAYLIIDSRYIEKARKTVIGCEVILQNRLFDQINALIEKHEAVKASVNTAKITVAEFESLSEVMDVSAFRVPDHIPGKAPTGTVKEGQIIDLGGRTLEVLFTPGHTPSSIMLLDSENKLLFTADTYYPGPLYAMFGDSSFPDYVASVRKAADRAVKEKIEWVYCSHNYVKKGTDQLCRLADFLEDIQSGTIKPNETLWDDELYIMDDEISIFIVINLSEEDEPEAEKAARLFPIPANHPDGQLSALPMDLSA